MPDRSLEGGFVQAAHKNATTVASHSVKSKHFSNAL